MTVEDPAMNAKILQFPVGHMANFTYIIADIDTGNAAIIDPSWDLERIFTSLRTNSWYAKYVINTHSHFDHVLGNEQVVAVTGAKVVQHKSSQSQRDISVADGDIVKVGSIAMKILHTPGHSRDSICLLLADRFLFTGDTLFVGNCGRTDLPGSDPRELYHSLFDTISKLKDDLVVYPGHDYGQTPTSTIGQEKKTNFVLQPRTEHDFLGFMSSE